MEGFEHVAGKIGSVGPGGEGDWDRAGFASIDYGGDGWVEGEGFAPSGLSQ